MKTDVVVLGGGLAGLAAAAALGQAGFRVKVLEARPYLGGRASSYAIPDGPEVDNCQHILLRCCVNLLDFYRRLGVERLIGFHREFNYLEPGGRRSVLKAGVLPAPLHFTESFAKLTFLGWADKIAVGRGLLAIRSEFRKRKDLDAVSMLDWLKEKGQTQRAIERFWGPVLVSAINEDLDRMAARHGLQVFWLGFLADGRSYEMGIPAAPLSKLYDAEVWRGLPNVEIAFRQPVRELHFEGGRLERVEAEAGEERAGHYISALPVEKLAGLAPGLCAYEGFEHSPITGIHLWFDRPVTELPHAALLDRTIQWFFNKDGGRYLQLVVSASRSLVPLGRQEVIDLAVRELGEFLPAVREAKLERGHVVKEVRATFSACPGLEERRPEPETRYANLTLAGDWTRSGWPATMEGAVRSGYRAAEHAAAALGRAERFLLPDIA